MHKYTMSCEVQTNFLHTKSHWFRTVTDIDCLSKCENVKGNRYINWVNTMKLRILLSRVFLLWVCSNSLDSQICYFTEFKRVPIVDPTPTMEVYPQRENSENETVITSSGDLVLNNGENFTIECFGDYPIELIIQRGSKRVVCIN